MAVINLPWGKGVLSGEISEDMPVKVLHPTFENYVPIDTGEALIRAAMKDPIGSEPLSALAKGKSNVVIIISDHTRPVPSKMILPLVLEAVRTGNPDAQISLLVATGCHRASSAGEMWEKLGEEIFKRETIVMHDCDDRSNMVNVGILPSGTPLFLNRMVMEADLVIAEGLIEPHFFAGYSGGRKSVLPGVAGRESVMGNHRSEFIADPNAYTGILKNNPIHRDMLWGAAQAKLAYIVNVIVNAKGEVIYAVAGDFVKAHQAGCDFLESLCRIEHEPADIVLSTNGGYPLDQNIYQAVKGMTAAEALVKPGGVIIMAAECEDGHGGEHFFNAFKGHADVHSLMEEILATSWEKTVPDQWQSQIFARVLMHAQVIFISRTDEDMVRAMHMMPAASIEEAIGLAKDILKMGKPSALVIPNGAAVVCKQI